jgi:uracil-DNA glycosylase family protein
MEPWTAEPFVPDTDDLDALAAAAGRCEGCPLHEGDVQTVFGEGARDAAIMLVGEQPGDQEDRKGHPFVGPAGRVLWECVEEAGLDRRQLYVTNAVKHFKHELRGKRRIHKRPSTAETLACHPWLEAELTAVDPDVVVALGAVAARAVTGRTTSIAASRGEAIQLGGRRVVVTYHPSAILRAQDEAEQLRKALVDDLRVAGGAQRAPGGARRAAPRR